MTRLRHEPRRTFRMAVLTAALSWLGTISVAALFVMPSTSMAEPLTQHEAQKLVAGDRVSGFGVSIAVSGDTAVVGAPYLSSGTAYVFTRDASGVWSEEARLLASDGEDGDWFGSSVAISGDTAVVGARDDVVDLETRGSAYVFERGADGAWSEQGKLLGDDSVPGRISSDRFGDAVAVSGDTAVIGARWSANGLVRGIGAAYVFTRDASGGWSRQTKLLPSDPRSSDFGSSVAISGDTMLISAQGDGSTYVYTRNASGVWSVDTRLTGNDSASDGNLGGQVALSLDGETAVIGSYRSSAYVYVRDGGTWVLQTRLVPSDGVPMDGFGGPVSVSGDTVAVGARGRDDNGLQSGAAYVYVQSPSGDWVEQPKLLASDGERYDFFGAAVVVAGDAALIGASNDAVAGDSARGSVYAFRLHEGPGSPTSATLQCPGDISGDGVAELVLTTPRGQVRVIELTGALVNGFALEESTFVVDTALVADTNANGAPELVLLESDSAIAHVRDLLTSGALGTVPFDQDTTSIDLEVVADRTGNGVPELVRLFQGRAATVTVEIRDGLTAEIIERVGFAGYVVPKDLAIHPLAGSNDWPEVAVLGESGLLADADKIEIRDPAGGAMARHIWLGKGWRVLEQERLADLNDNGSEEVAVLRVHPDGSVNVQIRDSMTRERVGFVGFARAYPPEEMISVADINGNGADELVVFGRRADGSNQRAVIKDSRTGAGLKQLWFDRNFPGQDFIVCGDVNGNGFEELAFLGQRAVDGRYKIVVADSGTGERLAIALLSTD